MTDWQPAATAPFRKVVWVRNSQMEKPVKATRGYVHDGMVHEDTMLFTTVFTNDKFFPVSAGRMVCPDEWAEVEEPNDD